MKDQIKKLQFSEFEKEIRKHNNCSLDCGYFYLEDVHKFLEFNVYQVKRLVSEGKDPREDLQGIGAKKNLQMLLEGLETGTKGEVGTKVTSKKFQTWK